jgi:FkbM family methyltransferase
VKFQALRDISRYFSGWQPETIFDVGANTGQSVQEFVDLFPGGVVHSFEPVPATYAILSSNWDKNPNVVTINEAMGRQEGVVTMSARGTATGNKILKPGERASNTVDVPVGTIDTYCSKHGISHIDYLKIDAEGHDMDVVAGAIQMLSRRSVSFIQVECGLSPDNQLHVPIQNFSGILFPLGYRLLGIYGSIRRIKAKPVPRRSIDFANAVYFPEYPELPPALARYGIGMAGGVAAAA